MGSNLERIGSLVAGTVIFGLLCGYVPFAFEGWLAQHVQSLRGDVGPRLVLSGALGLMLAPVAAAIWHPSRPQQRSWHYRLTAGCVRLVAGIPRAILAVLVRLHESQGSGASARTVDLFDIASASKTETCPRCSGRKWIEAGNPKTGAWDLRQVCPACSGSGVGPR